MDNDKIKNRTNNIYESFHRKLNHKIAHYHPKISFLIEHLKKITKKYYDEYINIITSNVHNKNKKEENYICNDIINFIKKFIENHKEIINIDSLNQYLNSEKR